MVQREGKCTSMNNENRKNAVIQDINKALLGLLQAKPLADISISEITSTAQVSRNSFYRNFSSKEDIIEKYLHRLLKTWKEDYDQSQKDSNPELFGSLFQHLKENQDLYLLLKERNLFYLFSKAYLSLFGPTVEDSNFEAYVKGFMAGGVLGWIEEWFNRGLQESAETMTTLLVTNGMT
jgi:AcrR family transcriptional regulator